MIIFLTGIVTLALGVVLVEADHRSSRRSDWKALAGLILCGIGLILILISAQIYIYPEGVLL